MSTQSSRINFTKAALLALPTPSAGKRATYYDSKTRGLNIVVTDSGTKTFYLRRKHKGVSERVVIGRFPDYAVEEARGKASEFNSAFTNGKNPADLRRQARAEPSFGELFREYIDRYAKHHTKTWEDMQANFRRYLVQWDHRKVSAITRGDVQKLHAALGKEKGHHTANRTLELLRAVFNKGSQWGLCGTDNPATGVTKFKLKTRDRFIQGDELPRFFRALADEPNDTLRDYVLLSLLTDARKANVLSMRWDEINFERGTWNIPETKNGAALTLPLIPEALEILNHRWARKKADDDKSRTKSNTDRPTSSNKSDDYVLPGEGARGHLASPQKGWQRILQRAQLHYLIDTISAALQWSPEEIGLAFHKLTTQMNRRAAMNSCTRVLL